MNNCPIMEDCHKMYLIYRAYLERPTLRYAILKLLGLQDCELFKNDFKKAGE